MCFLKWVIGGVSADFMLNNKKVLITGSGGLSAALALEYSDCSVYCTSRSNDELLEYVDSWGNQHLDCDIVFNCAHSDLGQLKVLKFFSERWKDLSNKTIVNIGSIVADYPRSEVSKERDFFEYRYSKQCLQTAFSDIAKSYSCDIRLFNLGPIDTDMTKHIDCVKLDKHDVAKKIRQTLEQTKFKRIDFWE